MNDPVISVSREMIRKGSRSFAAASKLFGNLNRNRARMLYAWCRYCDDEIDGQQLGFSSEEEPADPPEKRLQRIREKTQAALAGNPCDNAVFVGLSRVVAACDIPHRFPMDLLDGFAMDVEQKRYTTLLDTLGYSYHVAGSVGIMMAYIMGVRAPATLQRAADLGIAFQLTNIARDVRDDAALGRVYLPDEWWPEPVIQADTILAPENRVDLVEMVGRLLDEADRYYDSAAQGIAELDFRSAWAVAAARNVYRDIGTVVRSRGNAAWDTRAVVGGTTKVLGITSALGVAIAATISRSGRYKQPRDDSLWRVPGLET